MIKGNNKVIQQKDIQMEKQHLLHSLLMLIIKRMVFYSADCQSLKSSIITSVLGFRHISAMSHSYNWCNLFWKITLRFLEITQVTIYKIHFSFSGNFPFKNIFYNCPGPCMGGCRILIILLSLQGPICFPFFPHQVSDWSWSW